VVLVRGYIHGVVIACAAEEIARRHPQSYQREGLRLRSAALRVPPSVPRLWHASWSACSRLLVSPSVDLSCDPSFRPCSRRALISLVICSRPFLATAASRASSLRAFASRSNLSVNSLIFFFLCGDGVTETGLVVSFNQQDRNGRRRKARRARSRVRLSAGNRMKFDCSFVLTWVRRAWFSM
jgi:hypothetical protein